MMKISPPLCPDNREQDYTRRTVKCLFRSRKIGLRKQATFLKIVSLWQLKYVTSNLYGLIIIIIIIIIIIATLQLPTSKLFRVMKQRMG